MLSLSAIIKKKGSDRRKGDKRDQVKFMLTMFVTPQIDYTKAGTCDLCYKKRENVSLANETCNCKVVFNLDKAFEVTGGCSEHTSSTSKPLMKHISALYSKPQHTICSSRFTQAGARVYFSASVSGKRLFLLRAEELPPEPPQVHGLQR